MVNVLRTSLLASLLWAIEASAQFCPGLPPWVFDDVPSTHPFCTDITWMAQRGVTLGCTTIDPNHRLYCPNDNVTRGQMAAFMRRLGSSQFPLTCASGQVMKWNGATWSCANDNGSAGWSLAGNAGTDPAAHFIGTTDTESLVLRVKNVPALRIVYHAVSPNIIGGNAANHVGGGVRGATIAGGGVAPGDSDPLYEFEAVSSITDHYGTIGGGYANRVGNSGEFPHDSPFGTVAGGAFNRAGASYATVSGGGANRSASDYASVGGGERNQAAGVHSTVAGGLENVAEGSSAAIGGGRENTAAGAYAFVAGGWRNIAEGDYSFAGGSYAHALHRSSFVWNGGTVGTVTSQDDYEFRVATGTVVFRPGAGGECTLRSGASGWACSSDRDTKSEIHAVDTVDVLARVAALPVSRWSFTDAPGIAHIGPMAQDFHAAFGLGNHPRHLSPMDVQGVALAAIQALNSKLEDRERELADVKAALAELAIEVQRLRNAR